MLPTGDGEPIDFLAPGILALAVMSTAMVSLGIATGFERSYGVLKRSAPHPRPAPAGRGEDGGRRADRDRAAGRAGARSPTLGWAPGGRWALALAGVVVGTVAFAGLGLAMAGWLRGEVNLAAANALYLVLLPSAG